MTIDKDKRNHVKIIGLGISAAGTVTLMPSKWVKPVVNALILPAHAQTSLCSMSDIAGVWMTVEGDLARELTLIDDGTGSDRSGLPLTWVLDGDILTVTLSPLINTVFMVKINQPCISFIGTTNRNGEVVGNKTE